MRYLRRLACARLTGEAADLRAAQLLFFAAIPAMLVLSVVALHRHAESPGQLVVGMLAAVAVSLLCILIGLVLPMSRR